MQNDHLWQKLGYKPQGVANIPLAVPLGPQLIEVAWENTFELEQKIGDHNDTTIDDLLDQYIAQTNCERTLQEDKTLMKDSHLDNFVRQGPSQMPDWKTYFFDKELSQNIRINTTPINPDIDIINPAWTLHPTNWHQVIAGNSCIPSLAKVNI